MRKFSIVFCGSKFGEGQALALRFFEVCGGQLFAIRRSQTTDGAPVVQDRQILNGIGTSARRSQTTDVALARDRPSHYGEGEVFFVVRGPVPRKRWRGEGQALALRFLGGWGDRQLQMFSFGALRDFGRRAL